MRGRGRLILASVNVIVLALLTAQPALAVETLRWERLPLSVPLVVGQERVLFVDRNVRVGVPAELADTLRVQSAGGALYLRASAAFESIRLQLQDVDTGALILLDVTATPASAGQGPLEPVRILETELDESPASKRGHLASEKRAEGRSGTAHAVVLTRFAAQSLYAPLRTVEPVPGLARARLPRELPLETLCPMWAVRPRALAAWRLHDEWVTAILLTNLSAEAIALDPRVLQGDFLAATFQHPTLDPAGGPSDTTVLYLVTRGHGLAQSLLPALSPVDPSLNLPASGSLTEMRP